MKNLSYYILLALFLLSGISAVAADAHGNTVSGRVVDSKTRVGVTGAVVGIEGTYLWAVAGDNGDFTLGGVQGGDYTLSVTCLGYVPFSMALSVKKDVGGITVGLVENTLAIGQVVVTAQAVKKNPNTSFTIGSDALKHMQVSNVADIAALLPGGKTVNPDLTKNNVFSLRSGSLTAGNAAFGTAVEVDGVRIGNNASFDKPGGVGVRNISAADVESIEVLTGVPSAEYGDLNGGMVKIHTRKGQTPWNVLLSINPRAQQVSLSKGFSLEKERGVINVSGEWSRAVSQLDSPYEAYTRRGLSVGYSNTFRRVLKFEVGVTGNLGGMNTENDPDAYSGTYTKVRDNVFRANTSLVWLLNRSWITNLKFDASVNFNDNRSHEHVYHDSSSQQPAVHAEQEGYFMATQLPNVYYSDKIVDSKELDYAASLKYEWNRRWGRINNRLKAGVQWKATGNAGDGEYYTDPALASNGYRPRPYASYPFMHNLALYVDETFAFPVGRTTLELMAGLRMENVFIKDTDYDNLSSFSPRFNARWKLSDAVTVRGGWGVTEKLPSYYVLYPHQEYRDTQTFGLSSGGQTWYVFHTQPFTMRHNPDLKWQRNNNAEVGVELNFAGIDISVVGFYNRTRLPYKYTASYTPFSYTMLKLPSGYTVPADPQIKVDNQTGMVYLRGNGEEYWTPMDVNVVNQTFVPSTMSDNGTDVIRKGIEAVVDFPQINPIATRIRFDAAYTYTKYVDDMLTAHYAGVTVSHTSLPNRSYQYVGIYANGSNPSSVANGRRTHSLDANLTAITHIPRARLVVSLRLEMSLLKHAQNLSEYNGHEYAYKKEGSGSIYDGDSYTLVRPVSYMDLDGRVHPFTDAEAANPDFARLILQSNNAYTFAKDGYDPYFSANLSITKEIGDHVSLSFFANNFTNSRRYVTSYATGVSAIWIPDFYYGLTCRLKF